MKRPGASTAATASAVADCDAAGVAASDISGAADSEADGVAVGAASSLFDAGREITITARRAIPIIAAINTRGEVPCLGAALGLVGAAFAGVVETFTRDGLFAPPSGTGGTIILLAEVDFFAAAFFRAGAFLATFLAAAFFRAGAFLVIFLAAAFFFAGAFFAGAFFAAFFTTCLVAFLAAVFFLIGAFFFTATVKLLQY